MSVGGGRRRDEGAVSRPPATSSSVSVSTDEESWGSGAGDVDDGDDGDCIAADVSFRTLEPDADADAVVRKLVVVVVVAELFGDTIRGVSDELALDKVIDVPTAAACRCRIVLTGAEAEARSVFDPDGLEL